MEKIVLPTMQRGYFSRYFWSLLWLLALLWAASWFSGYIDSVYQAFGVDSFSQFDKLAFSRKNEYRMMYPAPFPYFGMYASYFISGIIILANLYTAVYSARETSSFSKSEDGYWGKVIRETYDFPFSKMTQQAVFDRITDITVEQSGLGRILDTGTLMVKMITFTNADSKEQRWSIPGIRKPHERKAELEKALLGHEGLKVRLS